MTREEAIKEIKTLKADYWDDDGYGRETKQYYDTMLALDMAIEALERESCEDAISRQAAIDAIWNGINMDIYTGEVKEVLEALPPVTVKEV